MGAGDEGDAAGGRRGQVREVQQQHYIHCKLHSTEGDKGVIFDLSQLYEHLF